MNDQNLPSTQPCVNDSSVKEFLHFRKKHPFHLSILLTSCFRWTWFLIYLKQNLFHTRMIRPVVGDGGPTYLKQIQKERPGNGSHVIVRSGFKAIIQPVGVLCAGRSSC